MRTEVIDSDTSKHGTGADDDGPVIDGDHTVTLSTVYPLATFKMEAPGWWPGFSDSYVALRNRAKFDLRTEAYGYDDYTVSASLGYSDACEIEKLRYRWKVNKDPNGHLGFDEVFKPKDGSAIKHHVLNWDTHGATESPTDTPWTLDPLTLNNKAEGTYRVLAAELQAVGRSNGPYAPGDTLANGDLVPSIKTDGTGQKHFVVPKAVGGTVSITAKMAGEIEEGMDFDSLYEFVPMGSNATISSNSIQVKTDAPGEYTVQVRTKGNSPAVIASMNVWVVWAIFDDPTALAATVETRIEDGFRVPQRNGFYFVAPVTPSSLFGVSTDIPDLLGPNTGRVPGEDILQGGAIKRWDVSRRISRTYLDSSPSTIMRDDYSGSVTETPDLDNVASQFPASSVDVTQYPLDELIGNDDPLTGDEDDNPYSASEPLGSGTDIGIAYKAPVGDVASIDAPGAPYIKVTAGQVGETVDVIKHFGEFVRLQIGPQWYRVSDFKNWTYTAKFIRTSSGMEDNGSNASVDGQSQ